MIQYRKGMARLYSRTLRVKYTELLYTLTSVMFIKYIKLIAQEAVSCTSKGRASANLLSCASKAQEEASGGEAGSEAGRGRGIHGARQGGRGLPGAREAASVAAAQRLYSALRRAPVLPSRPRPARARHAGAVPGCPQMPSEGHLCVRLLVCLETLGRSNKHEHTRMHRRSVL